MAKLLGLGSKVKGALKGVVGSSLGSRACFEQSQLGTAPPL